MEGNVIEYFMWGYQQHVQISLQGNAQSLFSQIDMELKPTVFLLGILTEKRENRHPICLEPEDCGFRVDSFKRITSLATKLSEVDEDRKMFHSHPTAQENHEKKIANRAYIEAIDKILKREDIYGTEERFISSPTYIDGYLVFVILELRKEVLSKYYTLTKDKFDRFHIARSFIESAIDTFLKAASSALRDPDKAIMAIERPSDELLRETGKQFMYTISQTGHNYQGLHGLYDACNNIALLKYEGEDGIGNMIIAAKDHPNIKLTLELKEPILIHDYRKVRKFIELSDNSSMIISDSFFIYGLGKLIGNYNPKDESLFLINFIGHYKWSVSHNGQILMVVEYGQPNLPKERIQKDYFESMLRRLFSSVDKNQINDLWEIIMEATKQRHGTMLIISNKANEESVRLTNPSFPVRPFKLEPSFVNQITSIDGSVLLDINSMCYSIGVIIDGIASKNGDSSRGARFNSAIRYYEQVEKIIPTIIIVISEDGMIDIIPNLKPQVKHSEIIKAISSFKDISQRETPSVKHFNRLMGYFGVQEFYLSQEECDEINSIRKAIEEKFDKESIRIVYQDFKPNEEMNDSYFIKES